MKRRAESSDMPSQLALRYATPDDAAALAAFASKAFSDTYRDLDDPQEIADYVAENFNLRAVQAVIGDPAASTLLAEVGSELAGYAVIARSQAPSCVTGPEPIELARFYLAEQFIGRGHGAELMRAVHREARRLGAQTIWLGVYDRNIRAVGFYERWGFTKRGGKEFLFGGRVYIDPIYASAVRDEA
jgi:ribosomal protein S18 acetylase RimI-like enzyme